MEFIKKTEISFPVKMLIVRLKRYIFLALLAKENLQRRKKIWLGSYKGMERQKRGSTFFVPNPILTSVMTSKTLVDSR